MNLMRLALCALFTVFSLTASASAPFVEQAAKGQVSIMAYNVLYDSTEIEKSLDAIEQADADIVCLRELSSTFARAFEKRLGKKYPYRALVPKKSGTWGAGIASRFKVSNSTVFEEKPHRLPALEARVSTNAGPILVACLHLFPPVGKHKKNDGFFETMEKNADLRMKQAEYIVGRYVKERQPLLVVGDMNEGPDGMAVQAFEKAGFRRACRSPRQKCGATFPGPTYVLPAVFEIDHILGRGVEFGAARVIREGGSDHFPVFATFEISR